MLRIRRNALDGTIFLALSAVLTVIDVWIRPPGTQGLPFYFLGIGGWMLMCHRWQHRYDAVVWVLLLITFGMWTVTVAFGSFNLDRQAMLTASLALLISAVGGIVTLVRMHVDQGEDDDVLLRTPHS
jgi:hypothetical protein